MSATMATLLGERARSAAPGCEVVAIEADGSLSVAPDQVDVFLFTLDLALSPEAGRTATDLLREPGLRWVQSPGAGVDHPIFRDLVRRGVTLTNASGINAEPIAQYIFTYVLHWERNVALHLARERERHWEVIVSDDLTAKTLGIVGLGGIGAAAARVAKAFGMRVLGLRRNPTADPNVDAWYRPAELHAMLEASHYVVLSLPLTDATTGLMGAREFECMREDAVLINVARGPVVDEVALIRALESGVIKGASLDVTEVEPLPAGSPLWDLPNCTVTSHDAGYSPLSDARLGELFLDNLARYAEGAPLRNEIRETGLGQAS